MPIATLFVVAMAVNFGVIALEGPFTIAGADHSILALIVAAIVLYVTLDATFFLPKRRASKRKAELAHPVKIDFLIPPLSQRIVD